MEKFFRVILFLILTFIVIVILLIFFLKPASNEISGSSKSVQIVEEENYSEGFGGGDIITTVAVEGQNMVENSSAQQGFVPQENRTGFYFVKEKSNFCYQNKTTD
ncbi:hypothetical protein [Bacillus sp. UNCCL81]|uniref:hypothetical protein n=1 Tax=Bacillus sp. UNCCL81 TaxID=1502755 RepID=UPI0008EA95C7|nr:hypothetical protein [Bacillus sp. UNCCL81]SFC94637.1 hypothetical protein SAMN02799633_02090 [Bacillus sp. UNCCL81]